MPTETYNVTELAGILPDLDAPRRLRARIVVPNTPEHQHRARGETEFCRCGAYRVARGEWRRDH